MDVELEACFVDSSNHLERPVHSNDVLMQLEQDFANVVEVDQHVGQGVRAPDDDEVDVEEGATMTHSELRAQMGRTTDLVSRWFHRDPLNE
ncbi:MAG: hypothetical protein HY303_04205 [Candidatus Wallbacteria bacterium]|nr:hypothetical protein [Candidatus Wallbacteria bacterium]